MTTTVAPATGVTAPARGGLRYIPTVAFGTDLVLITFSVFAAILGRQFVTFPGAIQPREVGGALDVAGPLMILGWVALIFVFGCYRTQVFGAGLDEYKGIVNASLVTAAAVVACGQGEGRHEGGECGDGYR